MCWMSSMNHINVFVMCSYVSTYSGTNAYGIRPSCEMPKGIYIVIQFHNTIMIIIIMSIWNTNTNVVMCQTHKRHTHPFSHTHTYIYIYEVYTIYTYTFSGHVDEMWWFCVCFSKRWWLSCHRTNERTNEWMNSQWNCRRIHVYIHTHTSHTYIFMHMYYICYDYCYYYYHHSMYRMFVLEYSLNTQPCNIGLCFSFRSSDTILHCFCWAKR